MMRVMAAFAAWAAGTVIAVGVTWLGANVVVRNAGVGPGMPVINAAVLAPSAVPSLPSLAPTPPFTIAPTTIAPTTAAATGWPGRAADATRTSASPGGTGRSPTATASPAPLTSASASPAPFTSTPTSPSAGAVRAYTLTGGSVTLNVTQSSVQLVTAVPDPGYSVKTWSATGWLRVDFSSGQQVSYLIATWYQHAPMITVTN